MYPDDYKEKRARRALHGIFVGLFVGMIPAYIGATKGMGPIFWLGIIGMFLVALSCILYAYFVATKFAWCAGGILEALDGKIVTYHAGPFCYKVKELAGVQLVPITFKPITVTRTLRTGVRRGEILLYQVVCAAIPLNPQLFYNAFLRPNEDGELTPEDTIGRRIEEFLAENAEEIRLFYYRGGEQYVLDMTQTAAEQQLARALDEYGLHCTKAVPICKIEALFIS
ncbi:TPA: hypothetical protein DDX30_00665 [Candidatus Wolfebacteria bacterium]|nr:hypothetical protein [Candidatus Wolfebacteria bacterium]